MLSTEVPNRERVSAQFAEVKSCRDVDHLRAIDKKYIPERSGLRSNKKEGSRPRGCFLTTNDNECMKIGGPERPSAGPTWSRVIKNGVVGIFDHATSFFSTPSPHLGGRGSC